jgi:hypothetical protein
MVDITKINNLSLPLNSRVAKAKAAKEDDRTMPIVLKPVITAEFFRKVNQGKSSKTFL